MHLVDTRDTTCTECGHPHTADDPCHSAYAADYCPLCGTARSIG